MSIVIVTVSEENGRRGCERVYRSTRDDAKIFADLMMEILMPNANAVAQYLPFLPRYARAITGTQTSGDAYVAAVLEAIVEDPRLLDANDLRVTLYRLFSSIWSSVSINDLPETQANLVAAERNLAQITPKPRQAFLLISMEGFSEHQAAYILDVGLPVFTSWSKRQAASLPHKSPLTCSSSKTKL